MNQNNPQKIDNSNTNNWDAIKNDYLIHDQSNSSLSEDIITFLASQQKDLLSQPTEINVKKTNMFTVNQPQNESNKNKSSPNSCGNIDIETNTINIDDYKYVKEGDDFPNPSNLKDRVLKRLCIYLVEHLRKLGKIKEEIKLDLSFTSLGYEKIIKIMDLPLHQIICILGYEENYYILQSAVFENEKNKKLFEDILNLRLKDLLKIYYNQSNELDFNDNGTIIKFPKFDNIFEERYKDYKYKDQRIYNIKVSARIILSDFKYNFDKRKSYGNNNIDIDAIYMRRFESFKLLNWERQDELLIDFFNWNKKIEEEEYLRRKKRELGQNIEYYLYC